VSLTRQREPGKNASRGANELRRSFAAPFSGHSALLQLSQDSRQPTDRDVSQRHIPGLHGPGNKRRQSEGRNLNQYCGTKSSNTQAKQESQKWLKESLDRADQQAQVCPARAHDALFLSRAVDHAAFLRGAGRVVVGPRIFFAGRRQVFCPFTAGMFLGRGSERRERNMRENSIR
jgi:hypothetical protein